jgi:hypothetical protein
MKVNEEKCCENTKITPRKANSPNHEKRKQNEKFLRKQKNTAFMNNSTTKSSRVTGKIITESSKIPDSKRVISRGIFERQA